MPKLTLVMEEEDIKVLRNHLNLIRTAAKRLVADLRYDLKKEMTLTATERDLLLYWIDHGIRVEGDINFLDDVYETSESELLPETQGRPSFPHGKELDSE